MSSIATCQFDISIDELRWSQSVIYDHFSHDHDRPGKSIFETVVGLLLGEYGLDDIPAMHVMERDGKYYSFGNRRLKVFKLYDAILQRHGLRTTSLRVPVRLASRPPVNAPTTINEGMDVEVLRPRRIRFDDWRLHTSEVQPAESDSSGDDVTEAIVDEDRAENKDSVDGTERRVSRDRSVRDLSCNHQLASFDNELASLCPFGTGFSQDPQESCEKQVRVPAHVVGRVVGHRGQNLQSLQTLPGVDSIRLDSAGIGNDAVIVIKGTQDGKDNAEARILEKIHLHHVGAQEETTTIYVANGAIGLVKGKHSKNLQEFQGTLGISQARLRCNINAADDAELVLSGTKEALEKVAMKVQALLNRFITGGRRKVQEQLHIDISHLPGISFYPSLEVNTFVDFTAHGCTEALSVLRSMCTESSFVEVSEQASPTQHKLPKNVQVFTAVDVDAMSKMFRSFLDGLPQQPQGVEAKIIGRLGALQFFPSQSQPLPLGLFAPKTFERLVPYQDYQIQYSGNLKISALALENILSQHGFLFLGESHSSVVHVLDECDGGYAITFEGNQGRVSLGISDPPLTEADLKLSDDSETTKKDTSRISRFTTHKLRHFDATVVKEMGQLGFRMSCTTEQKANNHEIRHFVENAWANGCVNESGKLSALGSCHIKAVRFKEERLFRLGALEASVQTVRSKQLETSAQFVTFPELEICSPELNRILLDSSSTSLSDQMRDDAVSRFEEIVHLVAALATKIQEECT